MARLILLRLLESYFRHRWLYLLPFVLLLAAGVAYFVLAPPSYIARGTVYVQKNTLLTELTDLRDDSPAWRSPAQGMAKDVAELIQSEAFVRAVIKGTDLEPRMAQGPGVVDETLKNFRKSVWTEIMGDHLLRFAAKDTDPRVAQQLVDATIQTYLAWVSNSSRQESEVARDFFANIIPSYQKNVEQARAAMRAYLNDHPEPVRGERPLAEKLEIERIQSDIDLADNRLVSALDKEENARLALSKAESDAANTYVTLDAPAIPNETAISLRGTVAYSLLFLAVGALLSLVAVIGGALLDRSFRFPIDVRHGVDLPTLAMVPDARRLHKRRPTSGAAADDKHVAPEQRGQNPLPDPSAASS